MANPSGKIKGTGGGKQPRIIPLIFGIFVFLLSGVPGFYSLSRTSEGHSSYENEQLTRDLQSKYSGPLEEIDDPDPGKGRVLTVPENKYILAKGKGYLRSVYLGPCTIVYFFDPITKTNLWIHLTDVEGFNGEKRN